MLCPFSLILFWWSLKSRINWPASTQASVNHISSKMELFAQRRQATRNAANCQDAVAASVSCLLFARGPSAIVRKVAERVVNALKSFACWLIAHIRNEIFKRIAPPLADNDSPASVILEASLRWIVAASKHALPGVVSFTPGKSATSKAVKNLVIQAATRLVLAASQISITNDDAVAAGARTNTRGMLRSAGLYFIRTWGNDGKSSKDLPGGAALFWHKVAFRFIPQLSTFNFLLSSSPCPTTK